MRQTLMQRLFRPAVVEVLLIMLFAGVGITITFAVIIGAGQAERSRREAWMEKKKAEYGNYPNRGRRIQSLERKQNTK